MPIDYILIFLFSKQRLEQKSASVHWKKAKRNESQPFQRKYIAISNQVQFK